VQYRTTAGPGAWNTFAHTASTSTAITVTGLTNGTSYDFQVAAVNSVGTGPYGTSFTASPVAPTVPGAPTAVIGVGAAASVALSWTVPASNGGAAITDYTVQYAVSPPGTAWNTFSHTASTSTALTVTGLTNGTAYVFRVAAVNSVGTGSYSTASSAVTPTASSWQYDFTDDPDGEPAGWTSFWGLEVGNAVVRSGVYQCPQDWWKTGARVNTQVATSSFSLKGEFIYLTSARNIDLKVVNVDGSQEQGIRLTSDGTLWRIFTGGGDDTTSVTVPTVGVPFTLEWIRYPNNTYDVKINGVLVRTAAALAGGSGTYPAWTCEGGGGLRKWTAGDV
jgi:hypothetical protein